METNVNLKQKNFNGWEFAEDARENSVAFHKSFGETEVSDEWGKGTDRHRVFITRLESGYWKITGLRGKLKNVEVHGFRYAETAMIFVNTGIEDGTLEV